MKQAGRRIWAAALAIGVVAVIGLALTGLGAIGVARSGSSLTAQDYSGLMVAGATMLLTAVTGSLALVTWESLSATREAVRNSAEALTLERQQADIAREAQLTSSRPVLVEPRAAIGIAEKADDLRRFSIDASMTHTAVFAVPFINLGPGPALVIRALWGMGSATLPADKVVPRLVPAGVAVFATFTLVPEHSAQIVRAVEDVGGSYDFKVAMLYLDLSGKRAWRSLCWLERNGRSKSFEQLRLEITEISIDEAKAGM